MWRLSRLAGVLGALLAAGSASAQSKDTAVPEAPETPGGVKTPESPEEPEQEPEGTRPFGASPGSEPAVVDPTLTGMVMKVGPASEEDLKRGYVSFRARLKVDLNYDFRPILNEEDFAPASIPVGAERRGPNLNFNAKQTRLFFEGGKLTLLGPLIGHISADFYGEGSSGGDFRVYEAYAIIGPLLAGRKWTTFMDLEAVPDTLDFQGPGSMLATRREVLRYGNTFGPLLVQVSLERPLPDLTLSNPDTQEARKPAPDVVGAVEWNLGKGRHVRAAGVARWLSYDETGGEAGSVLGWGGTLSGLWTWGPRGWRTSAQVHYGSGLGAYTADIAGLGLDAVVVAPGRLEAVAEVDRAPRLLVRLRLPRDVPPGHPAGRHARAHALPLRQPARLPGALRHVRHGAALRTAGEQGRRRGQRRAAHLLHPRLLLSRYRAVTEPSASGGRGPRR